MSALFAWDLAGTDPRASLERLLAEQGLAGDAARFARQLVEGIVAHREELDRHIGRLAIDWSVERMAAVDRNILRIGAYELLHRPDVPASVAINEAVELAKRYSTPEAARFVNGILGQLARELGREREAEVAARAGDGGEGEA